MAIRLWCLVLAGAVWASLKVARAQRVIGQPTCMHSLDCSGGNGNCLSGHCQCKPAWEGLYCEKFRFSSDGARVAYESNFWTWGGSPIVDPVTGEFHLYSSVMSNSCGILHYCVSSYVIHLTAPNASGPYTEQAVALAPRMDNWDNGAIHGVSIHRLPNQSYALFYMGSMQPGMMHHPNCTSGSGDASANQTTGSHDGRRIGLAISDSLWGPWQRLDKPLFGPDPGAWDNIDVSNPSPIIHKNGSVVMLYKGRGSKQQSMGLAFAASVDGPYIRNDSGIVPPDLPGEDPWGWIDTAGVYHAVFHDGNGLHSAGSHRWSVDAFHWFGSTTPVYTGQVQWANSSTSERAGKVTVLARRERPQILLSGESGSSYGEPLVLFTSAEDCVPEQREPDAGTGRPCASGVGSDMSFTCLQSLQH